MKGGPSVADHDPRAADPRIRTAHSDVVTHEPLDEVDPVALDELQNGGPDELGFGTEPPGLHVGFQLGRYLIRELALNGLQLLTPFPLGAARPGDSVTLRWGLAATSRG